MYFDYSTIIYLAAIVVGIGLVFIVGRLLIRLFLIGISVVVVGFTLLLVLDLVTGGSALQQLANALTPLVVTAIAAIAALFKVKYEQPIAEKYPDPKGG